MALKHVMDCRAVQQAIVETSEPENEPETEAQAAASSDAEAGDSSDEEAAGQPEQGIAPAGSDAEAGSSSDEESAAQPEQDDAAASIDPKAEAIARLSTSKLSGLTSITGEQACAVQSADQGIQGGLLLTRVTAVHRRTRCMGLRRSTCACSWTSRARWSSRRRRAAMGASACARATCTRTSSSWSGTCPPTRPGPCAGTSASESPALSRHNFSHVVPADGCQWLPTKHAPERSVQQLVRNLPSDEACALRWDLRK